MRKLNLFLQGKMPSLNEYISKMNGNRYIGNNFKRKIEKDLCQQILAQKRMQNFDKPFENMVDFYIVYIEKNKKRDKDNIASSKKFILDALVKSEVIYNDGWRWVGNFTEEFEIRDNYGVEIRIIERKNG